MTAIYMNTEQTIGNIIDGNHITVVEAGQQGWQAFLAMNPDPYVPQPEPDPLEAERAAMKVSRLQARKAMRDAGIFAAVDAAVAASGNDDIQDAWANAIEFRRFSPTILALSAQIGLTDTQLDDLFRAAAAVDL